MSWEERSSEIGLLKFFNLEILKGWRWWWFCKVIYLLLVQILTNENKMFNFNNSRNCSDLFQVRSWKYKKSMLYSLKKKTTTFCFFICLLTKVKIFESEHMLQRHLFSRIAYLISPELQSNKSHQNELNSPWFRFLDFLWRRWRRRRSIPTVLVNACRIIHLGIGLKEENHSIPPNKMQTSCFSGGISGSGTAISSKESWKLLHQME